MSNSFQEGSVVICGSTQSGSVVQMGKDIWVLLLNNDIWIGPAHQCRIPQDDEDLKNCPLEVERFEARERKNFVAKD
ncbi:MAG TPA: hypothetical protein VIJ14_04780 [Rhabdochlamydiaceae bacterium]